MSNLPEGSAPAPGHRSGRRSRLQRIGFIRALDTESVAWLILGSVKQLVQRVLEEEELDLDHLSRVLLDFNLQGIMVSD